MSDDLTYAAAGVSLDAADAVVERLKGAVRSTTRPGVIDAHGGFAGLLALNGLGYADPVLVAGTDGVGTKLELHREAGSLHAAGIDCVAMCVNDILCVGAEPLLFLDYVSVGVLDPDVVATLVEGIADGCRQAGAALLGGETAEHPGVMDADSLDVAGFALGIAERDRLIDGARVAPGDAVIGIASSGLHSNGFSLVRRVVERAGGLASAPADLLAPTAIYVAAIRDLRTAVDVRALAHITGGGIEGNAPRVLPDGCGMVVDPAAWPRPAVVQWLADQGVEEAELRRVFNLGIGMIAIVDPAAQDDAIAALAATGHAAWRIGAIEAGTGVRYAG
ncbi:MAG: phosphoribosylformylglycinamidine cyclo-ligase [Gaiellales bacterium]